MSRLTKLWLFAALCGAVPMVSCGGGGSDGGGGSPSSALTIATASLPAGTAGTPYSTSIAAAGGVAPYAWTIAAGTLPEGLTLSASGVISGTPETPTNSSFTVRVGDSAAPHPS